LIGDIHQPLHVGSVYLSPEGVPTNPNRSEQYEGRYDNFGGNQLLTDDGNLHGYWDDISNELFEADLVAEAATVPDTEGEVEQWGMGWADESLEAARTAF